MLSTHNIRHIVQNIQRHSSLDNAVELVYTSSERWPLAPHPSLNSPSRALQVSVLDSSFNCPTLAHLALANALRPSEFDSEGGDYDAKLLLLSVRNADKSLKPGDATYEQRVEMMTLMAKDIIARNSHTHTDANVAVGLINEPTFVGKSDILRRFIRSRLSSLQSRGASTPRELQLTFLLGFDTLERLFSPRYYISPQSSSLSAEINMLTALRSFLSSSSSDGHNSRIVCARRPELSYRTATDLPANIDNTQKNALGTDVPQPLASAGEFLESSPKKITIIDIGDEVQAYSSSEVRGLVAKGDLRWKTMVTGGIAEYIERKQLYKQ